jgi:hypothetical protein
MSEIVSGRFAWAWHVLQGHIGPGLLLVFWGLCTTIGVLQRYMLTVQHKGKSRTSYMSRAWHPLPFLPTPLLIEPMLKLCGGVIAMMVELRLDHDSYMYALTSSGS